MLSRSMAISSLKGGFLMSGREMVARQCQRGLLTHLGNAVGGRSGQEWRMRPLCSIIAQAAHQRVKPLLLAASGRPVCLVLGTYQQQQINYAAEGEANSETPEQSARLSRWHFVILHDGTPVLRSILLNKRPANDIARRGPYEAAQQSPHQNARASVEP